MIKKILNKYYLLSQAAKASLWFIISNILLKGISFVTLPIFSRILTTEQYGVVSVYQSWITIMSIFTTLTIWGGVFNVAMVKYPEEKEKVISSFQGLATFITLLFLVCSLPFLSYLENMLEISKFLIVCMYLEILAQIPFNIWSTKQRYDYEYKKLIFITCLIAILNPLLGYFSVIHTVYKAEARIVSNLVIHIVLGIILFIYNHTQGKQFFSSKFWSYGLRFNIVLIPHYLSTQILNQSDRLMINRLCGSSAAGIYSIAYNFSMLLSLITNGINSSLTPFVYKCLDSKDFHLIKKRTNLVIFLVALIDIVCICFLPDLFILLLPDSYLPALEVIPPVTVGAYFLFLYPMFGSIEFYYGENKFVTYASCIGAVLNVLLNYIFIQLYGFIAAAYTTLLCYIIFSFCHYYFMKKVLKVNHVGESVYDGKFIFMISFILVLSMFILLAVYNNLWIRWMIIIVALFVMWFNKKRILEIFIKKMN